MEHDFESGLNQHGYAFQYRVLREVAMLSDEPLSQAHWELVAVEVPVSAGARSTRIDFVLEDAPQGGSLRLLVAEVKRVNPAFGRWCFAKVPYPTPAWTKSQIVTEQLVNIARDEERWTSAGLGGPERDQIYQIAFVLRTNQRGDSSPVTNDKDAIEAACTQVCRGLNGLVNGLVHDDRLRTYVERLNLIEVLPVVFTTARLSATSEDLTQADLDSGEIALGDAVQDLDWLLYQYPQSPDLKHQIDRGSVSGDSFADILARDFIRTVAIVGPRGIRDFLRWSWTSRREEPTGGDR